MVIWLVAVGFYYPNEIINLKPMKNKTKYALMLLIILSSFLGNLFAQEIKPPLSAEELAKKLSNPIASLISVPFQNNTDIGIGANNGARNTLNIQLYPLFLSTMLPVWATAKLAWGIQC
jgi:hypothetical protein